MAKGDVEVTVVGQHPGTKDPARRPEPGTVLKGPGEKTKIDIEARSAHKNKEKDPSGKEKGSAYDRVEIFGKLQKTTGPEKKAAPKRGRSQ